MTGERQPRGRQRQHYTEYTRAGMQRLVVVTHVKLCRERCQITPQKL